MADPMHMQLAVPASPSASSTHGPRLDSLTAWFAECARMSGLDEHEIRLSGPLYAGMPGPATRDAFS